MRKCPHPEPLWGGAGRAGTWPFPTELPLLNSLQQLSWKLSKTLRFSIKPVPVQQPKVITEFSLFSFSIRAICCSLKSYHLHNKGITIFGRLTYHVRESSTLYSQSITELTHLYNNLLIDVGYHAIMAITTVRIMKDMQQILKPICSGSAEAGSKHA